MFTATTETQKYSTKKQDKETKKQKLAISDKNRTRDK